VREKRVKRRKPLREFLLKEKADCLPEKHLCRKKRLSNPQKRL